ncbi:DUF4352 domain-containing protein [Paraliobacillus sediminis]|uniref:DUF4352 domain-containing protein n=1 Tax=Paraliobacillus sediminis TaxID=1885916 RepID=UPI000E3D00D4|nr:DUF4352 domain-containing protein [Paraliobacillus sediminis]
MKNLIKLMVTGMVIAFVLVGCNNDDEANETSDNEVTEDSTEASETAGEADEAESEGSDSDASDSSSDSKGEILSLGETGTMETILGNFEVTPSAVQFLEEVEDDGSYAEPGNGVFVVVDVKVKNIHDKPLESSDIISLDLVDRDGAGSTDNPTFSSIESFEGEIAPGEEMTGQLIFNHFKEDYYQLQFGADLSTVSNAVTWEFTADEAE